MTATSNINTHPQHTDWAHVPVERLEAGIERQMIVGERLMICRLRFAPRVVTPPHDHPHEQITFVERGRVLFTIGTEQRIAQAGDVLHFPPGSWHGATMLDEEVILIDIFSPVREDFLNSSQFYGGNGQKDEHQA
ncbi:MAG: cupin domain-containing protein [Acidobacteria bacterium]|nr:MAG: cupin domain-containing protein [Acidobacteriota bacterium]